MLTVAILVIAVTGLLISRSWGVTESRVPTELGTTLISEGFLEITPIMVRGDLVIRDQLQRRTVASWGWNALGYESNVLAPLEKIYILDNSPNDEWLPLLNLCEHFRRSESRVRVLGWQLVNIPSPDILRRVFNIANWNQFVESVAVNIFSTRRGYESIVPPRASRISWGLSRIPEINGDHSIFFYLSSGVDNICAQLSMHSIPRYGHLLTSIVRIAQKSNQGESLHQELYFGALFEKANSEAYPESVEEFFVRCGWAAGAFMLIVCGLLCIHSVPHQASVWYSAVLGVAGVALIMLGDVCLQHLLTMLDGYVIG